MDVITYTTAHLDLRLQNLESETPPEKPKEAEPEMEDLPPVLDPLVDPPNLTTQEPTLVDSADNQSSEKFQ